ncbi:MFS transporter [Antribacter gilvus]|uniref:MFS transporter n=1 Tax=Antribacter gilvus TaxID=2304675 RepID=UPI000F768D03|nr:MFS transporter [Antribacter gilvus]
MSDHDQPELPTPADRFTSTAVVPEDAGTEGAAPEPPRLRFADPEVRTFVQLLVNVLLVSVINYTVWFAITFYVYLETGSVFATGIISGIFLLSTVLTGIWFGSLVDHHRKKVVMQVSAAVSLTAYVASFALYLTTPASEWQDPASPRLWLFVVLLMVGVIAGNIRNIALPTVVTALFDETRRDRANGLVGTVMGISFLVTSVISGLLVGSSGMLWVLILAVGILAVAIVHLQLVRVPEVLSHAADEGKGKKVDLRGTIQVVRVIPGMVALIGFAAVNNLLGGVFMALMDAYGLSMMSVQAWGLVWGGLSALMIVGGLMIARTGLGSNPVRTILVVNLILWGVTVVFPLRDSVIWLVAGLAAYMVAMPYVEASEQTVLQKVVPYERQGRVFGFAQSVEQAASPLTAFLISPLTQFFFIPFMSDGAGARWIGSWFGTGQERGIALVFVITAVLGLVLTTYALSSKYYRLLSKRYQEG